MEFTFTNKVKKHSLQLTARSKYALVVRRTVLTGYPKWNHNGSKQATMTTLTLKNIPDDLYERLKQSAEENRRSINSEILFCLEKTLRPARVSLNDVLERAQRLRRRTTEQFTLAEIEAARRQGRR
jgi:antitoxin FitA